MDVLETRKIRQELHIITKRSSELSFKSTHLIKQPKHYEGKAKGEFNVKSIFYPGQGVGEWGKEKGGVKLRRHSYVTHINVSLSFLPRLGFHSLA